MSNQKYQCIVLDIDNTLTELQPAMDLMAQLHNKESVLVEKVTSFRLAELYGLTDEEEQKFWKEQEPALIADAVIATDRVKQIIDTYTTEETQIHLVSNRGEELQDITEEWVNRVGIPYTTVTCIGKQNKLNWIEKEIVLVDAVFEDNPDFFYDLWDSGLFTEIDTYCIDYPYNFGCPSKYRLDLVTGKEIRVPEFLSDVRKKS